MKVESTLDLRFYQSRINKLLDAIVLTSNQYQLHDAINYTVQSGGKRLRPILVYLTGEMLHLELEALDPIALSIELIHCYSCVHDDLPAMDNDDLRRGRPTCHKAFNEATAILVGDALQALAFEILAKNPHVTDPYITIELIKTLAVSIGRDGLVLGQALDLAATGKKIALSELVEIYNLKTASLMLAAIHMTCIAGKASTSITHSLQQFAYNLGVSFQLVDDFLEATSSTIVLGKSTNSDEKNAKCTIIKLLDKAEVKKCIEDFYSRAIAAISATKLNYNKLIQLAAYCIERAF